MAVEVAFYLDEDLPTSAARIARGLGLDAVSVHELDRRSIPDDAQLRIAFAEGRVLVTRNRDDFQELNEEFYRSGEQHLPILIVTRALPNVRPDRIAHALKRWADEHADLPSEALLYLVDYLT